MTQPPTRVTAFVCPVDGATVEVPPEWDRNIEFQGVLIHEREMNVACWVLFHIAREHGREALVNIVQKWTPKECLG